LEFARGQISKNPLMIWPANSEQDEEK